MSSLFASGASSAPPVQTNPNPPQPSASALVPLTEADLKAALPANLKSAVTPSLVAMINQISADPIMAENIRNNFLGYTGVLKEGKFKTEDYLNAVAYVSYKLMGHTNEEAYASTFPHRYAELLAKGTPKKNIASYVTAYHKGKLVNLIMEQCLVPTWVLNQDILQEAITTQAWLMRNANSEKVRTDAANSLMNHLKKPDAVKAQISLDINETSGMKEMREMLTQLSEQQRDLISQGQMKTIDVAASRLIAKPEADDV